MQSLSSSLNNLQRNKEEEENLIVPLDGKVSDIEQSNTDKIVHTYAENDEKLFTSVESEDVDNSDVVLKLTFKRWLVLLTFSLISLISAFNWIEYNIIQDVTIAFYNESLPEGTIRQNEAVNWMSMVYMLCYIPLVFPSMFLLDLKGLKLCVSIGALLTCIGAWIKTAAVNPNRFAIAMLGQTFCAVAQSFTLGVPARLSSLWFGPSEISTATSLGVFGNQLGTALGFLIPPSVIPNASVDLMTTRFYYLLIPVAVICTILFILSVIVIKDKPSTPPNLAQARELPKNQSSIGLSDFNKSLKNLFTNRNYVLIFLSYGINTGSYYSISTLLNQLILPFHQNENEKIGYIGLILVLSGLLGALLGGFLLDRTKAFKLVTLLMYVMCLVSMILFTFTIKISIWIIFATAFLLGFFMTGYLPVGFEFAAELTYPEPEGTSSGLLNTSAQIFGIAFIYAQGTILNLYGVFYANIFICIALSFGLVLTLFITPDYRRQNALNNIQTNAKHRRAVVEKNEVNVNA